MSSMAVATVTGNVGRDPELAYTPSGQAYTRFSVAVSTPPPPKGDDWGTNWYRITVWGQTAERLQQTLRKGHTVVATGRLQQREWLDNDGTKRTSVEITAYSVIVTWPRAGERGDAEPAQGPSAGPVVEDDDNEIPF